MVKKPSDVWFCCNCKNWMSIALCEVCISCEHFRCVSCQSGPATSALASSTSQHAPDPAGPNSEPTSDEETSSSSGDDGAWNDTLPREEMTQLPSGIDPDDRLMNPSKYFGELKDLENVVFLHSAFGKLGPDGLRINIHDPFKLVIRFPHPAHPLNLIVDKSKVNDVKALATSRELLSKVLDSKYGGMGSYTISVRDGVTACIRSFLDLVECRNVLMAVLENVSRLKYAGYCTFYISLLVLESDRNVARLARLYTSDITRFRTLFDNAVRARFSRMKNLSNIQLLNPDDRELIKSILVKHSNEEEDLTRECKKLLVEITGLQIELTPNEAELWRCLVHTLDLAVLSYVGAHVWNFYECYLSETLSTKPDPSPQQEAMTIRQPAQKPVVLDCGVQLSYRHRFRCLDSILDQQPLWIFQTDVIKTSRLYLSTDIETFSDIWGPLWKVSSKTEPQITIQYNVGGGSIKRSSVERGNTAPSLRPKELFCHWESAIRSISTDRQQPEGANIIEGGFEEHDILLIGGASSRLVFNEHCWCDSGKISQKLQNSNCLLHIGTSKSSRVQDTETVQVQVGGGGFHVGYQRSFKLRTARTWKQALLESWENSPERRNPWVLQHHCGVEMSMCTRNSRRIRLIEVLRTQTMRNFMKLYSWRTTDCQDSFHRALDSEDLSALSRLILDEKDPERRGEYGSVLSTCFKALSTTGLCDNAELSLLWASQPGSEYLVLFLRSEHTWTGFLKDSVHSCTFAVLENSCLISTYSSGRECQSPEMPKLTGYSVFETNIVVNERIIPDGIRRRRAKTWDVSKLSSGYSFAFGDQGKLITMAPLSRSVLLAYWRPHKSERLHEMKEMVNEMIGREAGIYHREYNQTEPVNIRPIPVLVVSEQREPC